MNSLRDYLAKMDFADEKEFKSITDFEEINIDDVEVLGEREFEWETAEGEKISYKRVVVKIKGYDGEIYVPISVMKSLKALIERYGDKLKAFSVIKIGEGRKTRYDVIPFLRESFVSNKANQTEQKEEQRESKDFKISGGFHDEITN